MDTRIEAIGVAVGKTGAYGGGATALIAGMSASELAALAGIVIALLGWMTQIYFSRRRDRREQAEHMARMRSYGGTD